ncbi:hypothetical protein HYC85_020695 [Camellia sinensis]|uniref:Copper amine oxidase N3-terminal domain-containing protein n=1 Tax=Camellia sinensis TaxID=4442 RepID=A0A7J7GQI3_CAMSI|nr:hypothetical protein HYC85_020695 [Camellia sinensis]
MKSISKEVSRLKKWFVLVSLLGGMERERVIGWLVRVMCHYLDGTVNLYMRPIERITVIVDLDLMKIEGFMIGL